MDAMTIFPAEPELRMLRSIAANAFLEASRIGHAHATFHDYEFDARRIGDQHRHRPVPVLLLVRRSGLLVLREVGDVTPASEKRD